MEWKIRKDEHEKTQNLLSDYLEGAIDTKDRRSVERHLAACELCRNELASLTMARELLRQVPEVEPPHSFAIRRDVPVRPEAGYLRGMALATAASFLMFIAASAGEIVLTSPGAVSQPASAPALMYGSADAERDAAREEGAQLQAPSDKNKAAASQGGAAPEASPPAPAPQAQPGPDQRRIPTDQPPAAADGGLKPPYAPSSPNLFTISKALTGVVTTVLALTTFYLAWKVRQRA